MSIEIEHVSIGIFKDKTLREVDLLDLSDKDGPLKNSIEGEIVNLLNDERIEHFTIEMINEPRKYYLTLDNMNDIERSFQESLENLVIRPQDLDVSKLKSAKERAIFINFIKDNKKYVAIYKIPRGGKLDHVKVLTIEKRKVNFIESSKGVELPDHLTAIYSFEDSCFWVNDLYDFDQLLLSHEVQIERAQKTFTSLSNGRLGIAGMSVKGLKQEWFKGLKYNQLLSLYRYDEDKLTDISEDQIMKAVKHQSIPSNKRVEITNGSIYIQNEEQVETLVSLLSRRILLNLITGENSISNT